MIQRQAAVRVRKIDLSPPYDTNHPSPQIVNVKPRPAKWNNKKFREISPEWERI